MNVTQFSMNGPRIVGDAGDDFLLCESGMSLSPQMSAGKASMRLRLVRLFVHRLRGIASVGPSIRSSSQTKHRFPHPVA
ncbi:MAG TPA: hypothetical protein DEA90_06765 [Opitutae bacterium]|nr:hypothetical protein [Puniceicoccaceae bacterium]HBR93851.1 hypothetical protein [Opitutae bacterium]